VVEFVGYAVKAGGGLPGSHDVGKDSDSGWHVDLNFATAYIVFCGSVAGRAWEVRGAPTSHNALFFQSPRAAAVVRQPPLNKNMRSSRPLSTVPAMALAYFCNFACSCLLFALLALSVFLIHLFLLFR
jgi:hypothetical protein